MTYIMIWAVILIVMVVAIAIIDHIFGSDDDDHEDTIVIEQHIDGENNTSIGIQNNYNSDE